MSVFVTNKNALVDLPTIHTNTLLSLQAAYLGVPVESRSLGVLDRIDAIAHEVSERFRPERRPTPVVMLLGADVLVEALIAQEVGTELEREYAARSRLAS